MTEGRGNTGEKKKRHFGLRMESHMPLSVIFDFT